MELYFEKNSQGILGRLYSRANNETQNKRGALHRAAKGSRCVNNSNQVVHPTYSNEPLNNKHFYIKAVGAPIPILNKTSLVVIEYSFADFMISKFFLGGGTGMI